MDNYTPYQNRIRDCFAKAYTFLDSHKHPQSREDIITISVDIGALSGTNPDPLLKALLLAVYEEIEREYTSR